MSFSSEAKKELCRQIPADRGCLRAETCGLLLFGRQFSCQGISLITENRAVSDIFCQLLSGQGVMVERISSLSRKKAGNQVYTVSVPDENDRRMLVESLGCTGKGGQAYIPGEGLLGPGEVEAFLRGAFLACGTVTDPKKDYHLEFVCPTQRLAQDMALLLNQKSKLGLEPGMISRKGDFVVYLKGSEQIADLLTYLGAQQASMELIQVKMLKEVRNYVNRTTNFTTANIGKTASAAAQQIRAIQKIERKMGLEGLPEDLRELAQLRLDNPEMSLRELGESLSEPISRSGVNHRLRRILEIAEDIGR